MPNSEPRETCWSCRRTRNLCICGRIQPFAFDPRIVLLVHPRESRNSVGTARLTALSITNADFWTGSGADFDSHPGLLKLVSDRGLFPVILFPGPSCLNLTTATSAEVAGWVPSGRKLVIVVVDGTWSLARKMIRMSRILSGLPSLSFEVAEPSRYRFRRQPAAHCLSTVEAVHLLIENLHRRGLAELPASGAHDRMLDAFEWMVKTQLACAE